MKNNSRKVVSNQLKRNTKLLYHLKKIIKMILSQLSVNQHSKYLSKLKTITNKKFP